MPRGIQKGKGSSLNRISYPKGVLVWSSVFSAQIFEEILEVLEDIKEVEFWQLFFNGIYLKCRKFCMDY